MISSKEMKYEQENPVPSGTVCTALYDAVPEYHIDLDFKKGEKVVILEPCNVLFFYKGRNEEGKEGVMPINYFSFELNKSPDDDGENKAENDYTQEGARARPPPQVAPKPSSQPRHAPGSPVLSKPSLGARASNTLPPGAKLYGQSGWNDDTPGGSASASATASVVDDIDRRPPCPLPPEVTNPVNPIVANDNFKRTSGWFIPNVQQVIANKSTYSVQALSKVRAGLYIFAHKTMKKLVYCGGSFDLLNDVASILEHLYLKNDSLLTPLEEQLRRYPSAVDWNLRLKVSIIRDDLALELAKAIITHNSLHPSGLNPDLQLYTKSDWSKFTEWAKDK